MELQESKIIISEAKHICIIPSKEPEAMVATLALFYTLKELGKNVNLIIEKLPENLAFLTPSLDFISHPKNFVISIPSNVAQISQVFYEKNEEALKIHLTLENGHIKKDNISFYFAEAKPDAVIAIGIKDYSYELSEHLNSFGFLLDAPIINIDQVQGLPGQTENKNFGKINVLEKSSITEIIFNLAKEIHTVHIKKEVANCILAGIVLHTDNFKNNLTADIFEIAGIAMKHGATLQEIVANIYKAT